jgi:hypothetical protein
MGTKVELSFQGLDQNGYYPVSASNYDGYQGFNFADMGLLTSSAIQFLGYGTGTGYSNVIGNGENACAFTYDNIFGQGTGFGAIISPTDETFTLKKGTFASAWEIEQPTYFVAIGRNGHVKASVEFHLNQGADTIDFTKYGTDFRNVLSVEIISKPGLKGIQGFTGYQIAMDNLYINWNGSIPGSRHARAPHHPVVASAAHLPNAHATSTSHAEIQHHATGYHSVVTSLAGSLGHSDGGGLTAEFSLPQSEHVFGV